RYRRHPFRAPSRSAMAFELSVDGIAFPERHPVFEGPHRQPISDVKRGDLRVILKGRLPDVRAFGSCPRCLQGAACPRLHDSHLDLASGRAESVAASVTF